MILWKVSYVLMQRMTWDKMGTTIFDEWKNFTEKTAFEYSLEGKEKNWNAKLCAEPFLFPTWISELFYHFQQYALLILPLYFSKGKMPGFRGEAVVQVNKVALTEKF